MEYESHVSTFDRFPWSRQVQPGALTLAALGIVFGDIGTSPLYAFKEAFNGPMRWPCRPKNVLATLSALLWAVFIIVSIRVRVDCAEVRQ